MYVVLTILFVAFLIVLLKITQKISRYQVNRRPGQPVAIITGAASGIGRASAILFAKRGWFVGLIDTDRDGLRQTASLIGQACELQEADVTDYVQMQQAIEALVKAGSGYQERLDLVFACAGILKLGYFEDIPVDFQRKTIEVNLIGVVHTLRAAFPYLKLTPGAHAICASSASAFYGVGEHNVYGATKAAVHSLAECLNLEWKRHDIVVNCVVPAVTETPMILSQEREAFVYKNPLAKRTNAEAVAEQVWQAGNGGFNKVNRLIFFSHM